MSGVYVTLGAADLDVSEAFFDAALGSIGWSQHKRYSGWRIYSEGGGGQGMVLSLGYPYDGDSAAAGNGHMVGFFVDTRAEVDAFHAAAMKHGGSDEGPPGTRPGYGPSWYSAYVRDPVGNKLAAVCTR